ncbi:ABC transporter ATP-binding protein/permease [Mycobacterium sp. CBMA293]|uniref:ABC transporter ATP-binding protein/permease n=2 Tax=Mycolicibacterium TaxID=1866885 RepID=UPI0012DC50D5|nr:MULTISPECIES: ABC transporter ATP-binding protein/permease [unclassified Mycolicibacterium]MUL49164.1 ABC transporter ATP-binding protein/permease [Mycolicibacterium sp. CBMA 360]MUL62153.1 ABC transporter ATP-binding protein/permease [Mycolicibacterium sp. CBMA 335]MUL71614.1 ABC transporter ATP-binding protein/permease [Mycolicibacterium sp. CBMA 311]MUL93569.1 ABC transporter ATP-binding protein/permease [Mycolicibacterium sp. CBMA 230]MUM09396.1 multidrug ABC transporter ATP-binding pro
MDMFTPTLDWGSELTTSLVWIVKAWGIAAVAALVALVAIGRLTVWGRQFWQITGGYFVGRESVKVWLWLSVLLLSVVTGVRLTVLFSYQANDLMTSFQVVASGLAGHDEAVKASGAHGFWTTIGIFSLLATLHISRIMLDLFLTQRFILAWRAWLTDRLTGDWLDGKAYYRSRFIDDTIDNPDQRIQSDIDIFTAMVGPLPNTPNNMSTSTLLFGAINAITSMVSFTAILWNLSGTLTLAGVSIPRAMFWIGLTYVLIATVFAFWIGRPIIWLSFNNEKFNAAFRYALVRMRDSAEAVAFYHGEIAERTGLRRLFAPVVDNYKRYVNRMIGFNGWNLSMSQIIVPLPYILQFPRFMAGEIKLGDMNQTASAFGSILDGLSFFRNAYDQFAGYRAAIIRLHGLVSANEAARQLPTVTVEDCPDHTITLESVAVSTPDGRQLIEPLDLCLTPGEALVVTGPSGAGKTTLLRSLAKMWPYCSGTMRSPQDENETMFLSQLPYVPLGDLRAVVSYPGKEGSRTDDELREVLTKVALPHLLERLDEAQDWAKVLSPGEQQRVAFARVLLNRPRAVFFDESTSALDEGLEMMLYQLVRNELPETTVVSVSHRSTVEQHHEQELELLGNGSWRLSRIEDEDQEPARV